MEKLHYSGDIKKLVRMTNIAVELDEHDLGVIGCACKEGFDTDKGTREMWERGYAQQMELALQVVKAKSSPWPGASNVKFPLLTIAALNWHAKAYPAIVSPTKVVQGRVLGPENDPEGARYAASCRVADHMSYQLLEETAWEEETDRELLALPILGSMFRKTYYNRALKSNVSDLVYPKDLVVDYYTKSLETASRISHVIPFNKNAIYEREADGRWVKNDYGTSAAFASDDPIDIARDKAHKLVKPITHDESVPYDFVEQACFIDLDGDGYAEPYYVTFEVESGKVATIWARYGSADVDYDGGKVIRIKAQCCFTKIPFIPSPDGSFYDLGFGLLLGPVNHSVDTLINMLIDAGTMSNLGGGFLGRGVKIKGGNYRFNPQEWKRVESTGEDLNKSIYPLPTKEPSKALFDLLVYLVGYGERIAGSTDVQVGELPGDNAKTGVMEIANQNGRAIFSATFKRVWRGHKKEFYKLYDLNYLYFTEINSSYRQLSSGKWLKIQKEDYDFAQSGILPAADPNAISKSEKMARAQLVFNMAQQVPGHNMYEVVKRIYYEADVEGVEIIYPDPQGKNAVPPPPDVKLLEVQAKMLTAQNGQLANQIKAQQVMGQLLNEQQLVRAKCIQLIADAELKMSQSDVANKNAVLAEANLQLEQERLKIDKLQSIIDMMGALTGGQTSEAGTSSPSGGNGTLGTQGSTGDRVPTMANTPSNDSVLRLPTVGVPSP